LFGDHTALVKVKDTAPDPNFGEIKAWNIVTIKVGLGHGWARTWGEPDRDDANSVATDNQGHVYVAGSFSGTLDFDPGPGISEFKSNGHLDPFISKFDNDGNFVWARTWGGITDDRAKSVAVDMQGNVYVAGEYFWDVDFDPGPGENIHHADIQEAYLSKFDPDGNFQWVRTWPVTGAGTPSIYVNAITIDNTNNLYMTGTFQDQIDLDPGPGEDLHSSGQYFTDAYLVKLTSGGDYTWGLVIGGVETDWASGVDTDDTGSVYMTGGFTGDVDFDPGSGTDIHTSNGTYGNFFLVKFDPAGIYQWARTWGAGKDSLDSPRAVAVTHDGFSYATGYFYGTTDFDPGPGEVKYTSNGFADVFLSKFDTSGNFQWALSWGGSDKDICLGVSTDSYGNCLAFGGFTGQVDLDPGSGADLRTSLGSDYSLSKFSPDGTYQWAATWMAAGLPFNQMGCTTDAKGYTFTVAIFFGTIDFDPGPGTDYHTGVSPADCFLSKIRPDGMW
jgi:hypothetical protein